MLTKEFLGTYYKLHYKQLLKEARFRSGDKEGMFYEDIVQETFYRALRFRKHYDMSRPFVPWLNTIMNNVIRDMKREERLKGATTELQEDDLVTSESFMFDAEVLRDIEEEINDIRNMDHKNILYLALIKQMSLVDISQIVDESYANVKKIVSRFRQQIKEKYN